MTAADLRQRAEQCRAKIPLQLSASSKRCYLEAIDSYTRAANLPPGTERDILTRQGERFERLAEENAALVARHSRP